MSSGVFCCFGVDGGTGDAHGLVAVMVGASAISAADVVAVAVAFAFTVAWCPVERAGADCNANVKCHDSWYYLDQPWNHDCHC